MDIVALLNEKSIKAVEKREKIVEAIKSGSVSVKDFPGFDFDDKKHSIILEALEALSRSNSEVVTIDWLNYAEPYICSTLNNAKREASRVVGNIACMFPDDLEGSIEKLLGNTNNEGTVVRWGSAYALGRIVALPPFAKSDLYEIVDDLAEQETEKGVKNQYLAGLKKAQKLRK